MTKEKHSGRIAIGHKLAALMNKTKEEILHNKEQSTKQSSAQSSVQSTEQFSVQSTVKLSVQPSVQSNDAYVYGVDILAVFTIDVCVFFAYNNFPKNKKQGNEKQDQPPKHCSML